MSKDLITWFLKLAALSLGRVGIQVYPITTSSTTSNNTERTSPEPAVHLFSLPLTLLRCDRPQNTAEQSRTQRNRVRNCVVDGKLFLYRSFKVKERRFLSQQQASVVTRPKIFLKSNTQQWAFNLGQDKELCQCVC